MKVILEKWLMNEDWGNLSAPWSFWRIVSRSKYDIFYEEDNGDHSEDVGEQEYVLEDEYYGEGSEDNDSSYEADCDEGNDWDDKEDDDDDDHEECGKEEEGNKKKDEKKVIILNLIRFSTTATKWF